MDKKYTISGLVLLIASVVGLALLNYVESDMQPVVVTLLVVAAGAGGFLVSKGVNK